MAISSPHACSFSAAIRDPLLMKCNSQPNVSPEPYLCTRFVTCFLTASSTICSPTGMPPPGAFPPVPPPGSMPPGMPHGMSMPPNAGSQGQQGGGSGPPPGPPPFPPAGMHHGTCSFLRFDITNLNIHVHFEFDVVVVFFVSYHFEEDVSELVLTFHRVKACILL